MGSKLFHYFENGSFFKELDELKLFPNVPVKVAIFLVDQRYNIKELFNEWNPNNEKMAQESIFSDDEKEIVKLDFESIKNKGSIFLIIDKSLPIVIQISNMESSLFKQQIKFFNKYYPFISRVFLRSVDIYKLLEKIEEKEKYTILANTYVSKRYYGKKKAEVCYEKIGFRTAFQMAINENLWIDSINISIMDDKSSLGEFGISRKGIITYENTDFSSVYNFIIKQILKKQVEIHSTILTNKSRGINQTEVRAIKIILREDIFSKDDAQDKFINQLKKMSNWGYSIVKSEGSFFQLLLHDYVSGATYDILVPAFNEIYIIPQLQVTPISLNLLLARILDNYEGGVENV